MGAGFELTNLDEFLVYLAQSVVGACLMLFLSFGRISIIVKISKKNPSAESPKYWFLWN